MTWDLPQVEVEAWASLVLRQMSQKWMKPWSQRLAEVEAWQAPHQSQQR